MSHTPGPWSLERDYNGVPEFVFGGDTCVCDFGIEAPKPEDARLLAAAPELLECLQHIQGIVSESQGVAGWHLNGQIASWDELGLREEIDGVLAKVRGEEA